MPLSLRTPWRYTNLIVIIRLHRSTTYVDTVYCYRPSSVVCWSVTLMSPAKTAETIKMSFGLMTQVGLGNYVLDGGPDIPMRRGSFEGERGVPL